MANHLLLIIICMLILTLLVIAVCYFTIKWAAASVLYYDVNALPFQETALILGTAKFTQRGGVNHFFKYRIDAAELIFKNGKAGRFIVSGAGNRHTGISEAADMKLSLLARGLPVDVIITDDFGYRTWDSVWRCRHTFNCQQVVVVSQRFHVERAIFIGRRQGVEAVGFISKDVKGEIAAKMFLRECLARVKCIMDCYIINPEPAFIRKRKE